MRFPLRWIREGCWAVLAAAVCLILTGLGVWQLQRAENKRAIALQYQDYANAEAISLRSHLTWPVGQLLYRPVYFSGRFDDSKTVFLDNRVRNGVAGYEVFTPLALSDSEYYLLISRGWVAWGPDRSHLPAINDAPLGAQQLRGRALPFPAKALRLAAASPSLKWERVWQQLDADQYARLSGLKVLPFYVHGQAEAGLQSLPWQPPGKDIARHQAYAFQWFAMAIGVFLLYVMLAFKRQKNMKRKEESA